MKKTHEVFAEDKARFGWKNQRGFTFKEDEQDKALEAYERMIKKYFDHHRGIKPEPVKITWLFNWKIRSQFIVK